jgi:hypothetical protein
VSGRLSYQEQLEYWGMAEQNYGRDHLGWDNVRMWDQGVVWDREQRAAGKDSYRQPVLGELAKRCPDRFAPENEVQAIEAELRELVAQAGMQAAERRERAQASHLAVIQRERTFTVIGVWIGDDPVTVGVIEGEHQVSGGDFERFPEGCWAAAVSAPSADMAESLAVLEMRANEGQLEDEDEND